jgi:hypothetical protein
LQREAFLLIFPARGRAGTELAPAVAASQGIVPNLSGESAATDGLPAARNTIGAAA